MQRLVFIFFLLVCFNFKPLSQGPIDGFMKGEGNLDGAIGFSVQRSDLYYGLDDEIYDLNYSAELLSFFAQYGLSDKFDAVATVPFIFTQFENKFQDMGLFLKYRPVHYVFEKNHELDLLLSGGFTFPASDYRPDVTGAVGQRAQQIPLRGILQLKTKNGIFFNTTGTFNYRLDKLSDNTISLATSLNPNFILVEPANSGLLMFRMGFATKKHFVEIFSEWQKTFGGVNFQPTVYQPPQSYGVDYWKIGGTYYYDVVTNGLAINLSYIPRGRNIGNIISVSISFILKYRQE